MPRLVYSANYLTEANKINIVPQVVGMVEISSGGFAPGTVTAHATFPLPAPYNYDGRLRDVSSIDCSLNGAYGRVSFAITNADLGEVANVAADKYVGWECKVHKIIILENGTLLGILLLHGVITSYTMTDRVVDMDVVTRINVGNTITPRRVNVKCPWVFKGTECGYSGALMTCNKLYTDADGCSGRSNQHRFGGFPLRLPEASIGAVSGQGAAPTYQLIRDDSAFQFQRAILEFDNTFSVTDDPANNKTVVSVTGGGGGSGTVTSVAMTVPSFLSVTGSPITTSGTLAVTLATQNANTIFAGPTTGSAAAPTFRALVAADIPDLSSIYQPLDADLTAIAALTGDGLLRKTGGTWAMDSAVYLTANQTITLSGDVTGSGATSIATTIANDAVTTAKILNKAVTLAKLDDIASDRLLGRDTPSSGGVEQITVGGGIEFTGSGGIQTSALTGDVTKAAGGTSTTIANDAVTYAKMQNVSAASRILGRGSASGSGDVQELTAGLGLTVSGTAVELSDAGQSISGKNRLINGDFSIAQRGTSFTSTSLYTNISTRYTLDRWFIVSDTDDVIDVTRSTDVPAGGALHSIALDVENANKKFGIAQIIESFNCKEIIGTTNTVSLSFKAKMSTAGSSLSNLRAAVIAWSGTADTITSRNLVSTWENSTTNPVLAANLTNENTPSNLSVTTTWQTYKIENISIDTANTKNVIVFIWSNATTTTAGHFLYITDVQLEKGTVATAFERVEHSTQLARCQRYYISYTGYTGERYFGGTYAGILPPPGTQSWAYFPFPVTMRRNVNDITASATNTWGTYTTTNNGTGNVTNLAFQVGGQNTALVRVDSGTLTPTVGHVFFLYPLSTGAFIGFDGAEL